MIEGSFWAGRRVLVTGHTGFKGAWLSLWLQRLGARVSGLALAPDSPDGAFVAFGPWPDLGSHAADLRDAAAVEGVVSHVAPEIVFHLGAQALVRRGWADPLGTYAVNVLGTANVLQAMAAAESVRAVVVVTSDKVYANSGVGGCFREDSPLGGCDPYSASKAAAEHVVSAWRAGNQRIPVVTARAGNVIGGGDLAEDRLLPDVWRALRRGEDVILRHPEATRPWQFVLEPLAGYLRLAEALVRDPGGCPPSLNFGPSPAVCLSVAAVAQRVLDAWGGGRWVDGRSATGPPEAAALSLDSTLAARTLGWRSHLSLETAIRLTVDWWRAAREDAPLRQLGSAQISAYEAARLETCRQVPA